jgi:hypothetical protein
MKGDIIVLAGGASVRAYNLRGLHTHGELIAVNDSALYTQCDVALTMDRVWLEWRRDMLRLLDPPSIWYRKGTDKNISVPKYWHAFEHDGAAATEMTLKAWKLNGSNSGTCAVNLAFQNVRPGGRVFLLGFDMQRGEDGAKHWYPDYSWAENRGTAKSTYETWAHEFRAIAKQFRRAEIEIYNVNHRSLITALPVIPFSRFEVMTCPTQ